MVHQDPIRLQVGSARSVSCLDPLTSRKRTSILEELIADVFDGHCQQSRAFLRIPANLGHHLLQRGVACGKWFSVKKEDHK